MFFIGTDFLQKWEVEMKKQLTSLVFVFLLKAKIDARKEALKVICYYTYHIPLSLLGHKGLAIH